MRTIETTIVVNSDHTTLILLPEDVARGSHSAVLVVAPDDAPVVKPLELPSFDTGPWPSGLSLRREDMYGDDGR